MKTFLVSRGERACWILLIATLITIGFLRRGKEVQLAPQVAELPAVDLPTNNAGGAETEAMRNELIKLRGRSADLMRENKLLTQKLSAVRVGPMQASETQSDKTVEPQPALALSLRAADWTNRGFATPQDAVATWLWALREQQPDAFAKASGQTNSSVPGGEWQRLMSTVQASEISEVVKSPEGKLMVHLTHDLGNGKNADGWMTVEQMNGAWRIRQIIGFPIMVNRVP